MNPLGAWELPRELRPPQETARRFMLHEVKPVDRRPAARCLYRAQGAAAALAGEGARRGSVVHPHAGGDGGAGLNLLGQAVVAEEAARCRMGAYIPACGAFGCDPPNVIFMGTREQIDRYALPTVEGKRKDLRRDQRTLGRVRPGARHPLPRGA